MKKWRPYSLFLLLLISGALLTGAGYAGEHSIYADYSRQNGWMTPALSLVFQGAKDGVAPWELFAGPAQTAAGPEGGEDRESACAQAGKESAGENASDPAKPGENTAETQSGSGQEEKDGVSQNDMAGNGISENGVSGNGISENTMPADGMPENGLSGDDMPEGDRQKPSEAGPGGASDAAFTASDGSRYDRFGQLIPSGAEEGENAPAPSQTEETGAGQTQEAPSSQESISAEMISEEPVSKEPVSEEPVSEPEPVPSQGAEPPRDPASAQTAVPAPESGKTKSLVPVPESYFDDALFIGDSRTVGLYEYGGFQESTVFFAKTSLTIYDLFEEPEKFAQLADGKKATLEEALTERKFGKIYLMLGINELGRGTTESFFRVYAEAVNRIRLLQPDALIFIQGIMRVGEEKNSTDAIFNNTNINARNQAISMMADNRSIFYLEVNDAVCDENGNLISDYTFDQIHLKAKYYQLWKNYLFAHGAV